MGSLYSFYMPLHDVYQIVVAWMWATQQIW